jgi:hypothetical protein
MEQGLGKTNLKALYELLDGVIALPLPQDGAASQPHSED